MKIRDLIKEADDEQPLTPVDIQTKKRRWSDKEMQRMADASRNSIKLYKSAGAYYRGQKVPSDPHAYDKIEMEPKDTAEDAHAAYMKELAKLNGSNPYLPVVYEIKQTEDPSRNKIRHRFRVQKLVPLAHVNLDTIIFLIRMMLSITSRNITKDVLASTFFEMLKTLRENKPLLNQRTARAKKLREHAHEDFRLQLALIMRYFIEGKLQTDDDNLNQAIAFVRRVKELSTTNEKPYEYDLHGGNIMLRQIPTGYWPVYNDPISNYFQFTDELAVK